VTTSQGLQYNVTYRDIIKPESIRTLVGIPICTWHPTGTGLITPDTPYGQIGVCLGEYRLDDSCIKAETLCRITDKATIDDILSKRLVEVSPCYLDSNIRQYNHLAILPKNSALGGTQMSIKLESINMITPEQLTQIQEAVVSLFKTQDVTETATAEAVATARLEGIQEGIVSGRYVDKAISMGYTGTDVDEAKSHILTAAYPDVKVEGKSADYLSAMLDLAVSAPAAVETVVVKVPAVKVEGGVEAANMSTAKKRMVYGK
jgi:Uncharacterized protein conserved in bacteria (DUF2213)